MELAKRFRGMLADLGLKPAQAAKMLHVSLRTVHNWNSGTHQIPVMAYRLLRMMRYMELPGKSWQGWHFSRGMLITPEGREISGKDGAWWSLLVRQSKGFGQLYKQLHQTGGNAAKALPLESVPEDGARAESEVSAAAHPPAPYPPSCNTGGKSTNSSQLDVIMTSWPILYDFPNLSTAKPVPAVKGWESALTGSYPLPLMPICAALKASPAPTVSRLPHSLSSPASPWTDSLRESLSKSGTLPQALNQAPELPGKVICLPLTQSRFLVPNLARLNAPGWPTGTGATHSLKPDSTVSGVAS